jgi:hypothetical protein
MARYESELLWCLHDVSGSYPAFPGDQSFYREYVLYYRVGGTCLDCVSVCASAIMRKIVFPDGRKDLHHNGIFQDLGAVFRV